MISDTAMRGFGRAAGSYDRGRPEYPPHAIGWLSQRLDLTAEKTVLDVGAGTGKLTGALAGTGVRMIALEPVAEMRTVLEQRVPRAQVLAGTAEQVPLRAGVLDAVVAGQAFHWFDGPRALEEFHRVLRTGGGLGLIWNRRDLGQERHRAIQEIIEPFRREAPAYHTDEWRFAFQETGLFALRDETRIPFAQELGAEQFVDRVMSTSFISALEGKEREEVLGRLRALAAEDSEPLRYICEIFVYARR